MRDMTVGNGLKNVLLFAIPLFLGSVLNQAHVLVDSAIVGKYLGVDALAAVGVAGPIIYFIISIFIGVNIGFSILVSHYKGEENNESIRRAILTLLLSLAIVGALLSVIGILSADFLLSLLGTEQHIKEEAQNYLSFSFLGLAFGFVLMGLGAILRGLGDGVTPLYALILASLLNIVLDLYFILVLDWGVKGAALATVYSQGITLLVFLGYLLNKHQLFRQSFSLSLFNMEQLKRGITLGTPLALQHIFLSVGILVLIWIVVPFGTDMVAAVTIVGRLESFFLILFIELASAATTFVGQNTAKENWRNIKSTTVSLSQIVILLTLIFSSGIYFSSELLINLFTSEESVSALSIDYLRTIIPFFAFITLTVVWHGILNGLGKVKVPMMCTLYAFCIARVPLTYLLGHQFGSEGIWWAVILGWGVGAIYTLLNLYYVFNENSKVNRTLAVATTAD